MSIHYDTIKDACAIHKFTIGQNNIDIVTSKCLLLIIAKVQKFCSFLPEKKLAKVFCR